MKAATRLLAVLLMLSSTSLAQTSQTQQAEASQASTSATASTSSTEAGPAGADVGPAPQFAPGAKIFLEPMNGFGQILADTFAWKKVPVVVVKDRESADFVVSGETHLKKPNFFTGMVMSNRGKGDIAVRDARTGNLVLAYKFNRVDQMVTEGQIYQVWAVECANRFKKAFKEIEKAGVPPSPPVPAKS